MTFLEGHINNWQDEARIIVTEDVTGEPVTLDEVKHHLRVDTDADDLLLTAMALACRQLVEAYTGRRMMPRQERLLLDRFPRSKELLIPAAPVWAFGNITYYDQDNNPTVMDPETFVTDTNSPIGLIALKYGVVWPILGALRRPVNAVTVDFSSGYEDPTDIPPAMKMAILLLVGHFYENREETTMLRVAQIPLGVRHLLTPYRVWEALL